MFVHTVQLRAGMMTTFDERMLDLRVEILLLGEMMMLSLTQLLCRSLIAHTCVECGGGGWVVVVAVTKNNLPSFD